ncbi:hypothetical protein FHW36_101521 [Chitinophaga polysaccharea]|uniref:Uncharacterized protein n=1 Tax=Chitinophaga polysaccharea TaxID=1293035 RepID=A0A561Q2K7_9BACT|nr:hypothetical protein FHW36_101521 [Chitinophaga polysaccharea]
MYRLKNDTPFIHYIYTKKPVKRLTGYLIIVLLLLHACKPSAPTATDATVKTDNDTSLNRLVSTYTGDFGNSPIYITLNFFNGKLVGGYNTHKGLRRNLQGELKKDNDNWIVTLSEPGDHQFDGKFAITFDHLFNNAKGTWTPVNDKSAKEKSFTLKRSGEPDNNGYSLSGNTFNAILIGMQGGGSDLTFSQDGSCILQYYEKINDSTFAKQMIKVRGTYQKVNDSTFQISWEQNTIFKERTTPAFVLRNRNGEGDDPQVYDYGIRIDTLEFVQGP